MPIELFAYFYSAGKRAYRLNLPASAGNSISDSERRSAWMTGYNAALNQAFKNRYSTR